MSWKVVIFTGDDIRRGKEMMLQEEFVKLFILSRAPSTAVMYGDTDFKTGNSLCYFNPSAAALAGHLLDNYGAVDCPEPDVRSFAILANNSTKQDND